MSRHTKRTWRDPFLDLIARLTVTLVTARLILDRAETGISKYFRDNTAWGIITEVFAAVIIFALLTSPPVLLIVGIVIL